jgi:hypothetical protein
MRCDAKNLFEDLLTFRTLTLLGDRLPESFYKAQVLSGQVQLDLPLNRQKWQPRF